ncbi:malonyl-CoA-acyl carrier protein transacylase, mitochondrial [Haplochromis burtoni]|uniref:malonyl-CoA-acyl carrier protein transacylase, mitochondrial n=1 Tax=Haplochromis burtoni TaxID=8153 RepID=UPI001C2D2C20|nr:malonyl-CoA-acyl carrier protein transacylase, mitochondrial [Haplochromis burtoni]
MCHAEQMSELSSSKVDSFGDYSLSGRAVRLISSADTSLDEEQLMLASVAVRMAASSRGKVRSLVSLSRRLSTNKPGSTAGDYPPPAEAPASPPNSEPAAAPQRRPKKDPSGCSVLLFPGQGSQFVGMGRGLLKYPNVKEMFTVAQKILGYDLLSLCLEGPEDELQKTVHCQPAVFVTSLAAVERLNQENPKAIEMCVAAAGFSVGEFAALVFSGAMNFAEALYAVKVRAETMQKASELVPSGMLSVIGRPQAQYNYACLQAKEHCKSLGMENSVCSVANYLFPDGRVIAGHQQALDFLQENSRRLKFMRTKTLPVSGAFHTELMASATEPLREVLRQVEVRRPEISVYSNVDGKRYMNESHVRRQLVKQLVSPVKWEQTLHEIYERTQGQHFPHTYEVGPGRQLGATLQKCNRKAYQTYAHVEVTAYED